MRMAGFFNQYSYVLGALGFILGGVILLRLLRARWALVGLAVLLAAIALTGGWLLFRPGASDVDSLGAADAVLQSGNPTLIEFFSNYCAGCIAARREVDQLVTDVDAMYAGLFNILRVDIHTDFGRALRERYDFSYTPEFVIFNGDGNEVWRSHVPPSIMEIGSFISVEIPTVTAS